MTPIVVLLVVLVASVVAGVNHPSNSIGSDHSLPCARMSTSASCLSKSECSWCIIPRLTAGEVSGLCVSNETRIALLSARDWTCETPYSPTKRNEYEWAEACWQDPRCITLELAWNMLMLIAFALLLVTIGVGISVTGDPYFVFRTVPLIKSEDRGVFRAGRVLQISTVITICCVILVWLIIRTLSNGTYCPWHCPCP